MSGSVDSTLRLLDLADEGRFPLMSPVWRLDKRDESRERRSPARAPEGISVWHWRVAVLGLLALWSTGVVAQVYRYRHVSGLVERQQAKWVMFILGCFLTMISLGFVLPGLFLNLPDVWFAAVLLASVPFAIALPISIAFAILRYRLYDIDRIISRTLSYALLTGLLACVYVALVLILGQLFGGIGAEPPSWAVAAATLVVAALFPTSPPPHPGDR